MPQRRVIRPFNTPISGTQGGKAGNKDPRNFISGNVPGDQWDIVQFSQDRSALARQQPPQYSGAVRATLGTDSVVQTVSTRLTMIPWTVVAVNIGEPYLLVKKNIYRLGLVVCNPTQDGVAISFGPFNFLNGSTYGMPVPGDDSVRLFGDGVPIDDIWVLNGTTAGRLMLAFEGIEAPEANP
jgi:hypothetical protein